MSEHVVPAAALETHIGILGKTGSGKTYSARGFAERLLEAKRHVVVIDPTGAWWGLRTGFDIPIFGGRHADVEIGDEAGPAVARVVVQQRSSAIVDLSLMSAGAQRRFMRGFAHELRALKTGQEPAAFYLILDEADEFLPQMLPPDMTNLFGDLKWMVRRGRLSGFRVMMVTQRPAEIAKAVLTQIETLVAHRLTAPQDRKAVEDWVKGHHDPAEAREVLTSLASLDRGEAWVWCPDLNILSRTRMPLIATFDSGRTPEPGEEHVPPALAELDMSALTAALVPVEEAKPAKHSVSVCDSAQVRKLEEDWREATSRAVRAEGEVARLRQEASSAREAAAKIAMQLGRALNAAAIEIPAQGGGGPEVDGGQTSRAEQSAAGSVERQDEREPGEPARKRKGATAGETATQEGTSDREYRALGVLAQSAPLGLTEAAWAARAGYSRKGGAWIRRRARYVAAGLIEQRDSKWFATEEGLAQAGEEQINFPAPGPALVSFWAKRLGAPGRILQRLADLYPQALTRAAIAGEIGMTEKGGAFNRHISALKSGELVEESGKRLRVAPAIMADAA